MICVFRRTEGSSRFPLIIHRSSFPLAFTVHHSLFTIYSSLFTIDLLPFLAILRLGIGLKKEA